MCNPLYPNTGREYCIHASLLHYLCRVLNFTDLAHEREQNKEKSVRRERESIVVDLSFVTNHI